MPVALRFRGLIERFADRLGLPNPRLTRAQYELSSVRFVERSCTFDGASSEGRVTIHIVLHDDDRKTSTKLRLSLRPQHHRNRNCTNRPILTRDHTPTRHALSRAHGRALACTRACSHTHMFPSKHAQSRFEMTCLLVWDSRLGKSASRMWSILRVVVGGVGGRR